jgi:hypothetical protein
VIATDARWRGFAYWRHLACTPRPARTDGSQLAVSPAAPEGNLPVLAALALVVGTATGLLAAIFLLRRVATRAQGAHNGGRGSGIWGILEERITDDLWMPILKTDKPRAGFELGIKLARHGVKAT